MNLSAQMRPCRQKAKASFYVLLCWLPPEGVSQIFYSPFNLKWSNLGSFSPLQMIQSLTGISAVCVFVCFRCSKIDNQEQSSLIHIFGLPYLSHSVYTYTYTYVHIHVHMYMWYIYHRINFFKIYETIQVVLQN